MDLRGSMDATSSLDTSAAAVEPEGTRRPRRRRRILAGIVLVLACLTILVATVAVWAHQVAFNTDRFTSLVADVIDEPAVTDPLAAQISAQVVDGLDMQTRIASRLPDAMKPLAVPITASLQEAITSRLQRALSNPDVQKALVSTISVAHEKVMNLLRDRSDAVQVVDGYVVIDVWPMVDTALSQLQTMGLIPADIQLPDLSEADIGSKLGPVLESKLGVTLPPDFGTIQLMPADQLLAARTVVRVFDLVVILLIVLSIVLVLLALWLSSNRRHMVIFLALGTLLAFLLARLVTNTATDSLVNGIADEGLRGAVRTVAFRTVDNLRQITAIILVVTGIVAVAAYLWGRPRWVTSVASSVGGAAGQAGSSAKAAGAAGVGAVAAGRPSRETLETTVTQNRSVIERYGLAAIVFIVVWIALGIEIALIGAVLVIAFELVLRALSPTYEGESGEAGSPSGTSTPAPTPVLEPLVPDVAPAAEPPSADAPTKKTPTSGTARRSTKKPPPTS
jgi:hypothetical protein